MKKTLTTVLLLGLAVGAFAQGTINFGNNFTGSFRAPIYNFDPANSTAVIQGQSALGVPAGTTVYPGGLLSGANYTLALWAGSSANNLQQVATASIRSATDPAALPNGLIATTTVTVPNAAPGSTIFFQMRAWDTRTGASYDTATSRGQSQVVQSGPLGGIGPDGPILAPNTVGWTSFSLAVPEPSVIALGALGLGALLLRRRK